MENLFNSTPLEDFIFFVWAIQIFIAIYCLFKFIILLLINGVVYIKGGILDNTEKVWMCMLYLVFYIIYPIPVMLIAIVLEKQSDGGIGIWLFIAGSILYSYIIYRNIVLLTTSEA